MSQVAKSNSQMSRDVSDRSIKFSSSVKNDYSKLEESKISRHLSNSSNFEFSYKFWRKIVSQIFAQIDFTNIHLLNHSNLLNQYRHR